MRMLKVLRFRIKTQNVNVRDMRAQGPIVL